MLALAGPARGRRRTRGHVDAGGEQGVREGAGADRPERAGPVGEGGGHAAREDGRRREQSLQRPGERCRLHRGRPRAVPAVQQLAPVVRLHPGPLGRRRRRVQARLLPQARAGPRPGAEERRPLDGGRAQVVPAGAEEVRQRGLEEHLAQLRDDPDADAGGQPRAEVLHPAQLRRQGQAPVQHPRHHHRQPPRRRPRRRLATAAVRAHHRLQPRRRRPVRRARRREAIRAAVPRRGAPLRQREDRAEELVRLWRRLRRERPPADAMLVTGDSWHGEHRTKEQLLRYQHTIPGNEDGRASHSQVPCSFLVSVAELVLVHRSDGTFLVPVAESDTKSEQQLLPPFSFV